MPEISIIVPVYNSEKYLRRCIDSICNQTFKDFELIIVNDGSHDNSLIICNEYAELDPRIRIIDKLNEGVSVARNMALNYANGKYIGFVDSDDYISPRMYEKMYYAIKENAASIAVCGFYSEYMHALQGEEGLYLTYKELWSKVNNFNYSCWNKLYAREEIKGIQFSEKLTIAEDLKFNYDIACRSNCKCVFLLEKLYFYNSGDHSLSSTKSWNKVLCDTEVKGYICEAESGEIRKRLIKSFVEQSIYIINNSIRNGEDSIDTVRKRLKKVKLSFTEFCMLSHMNRIHYLLIMSVFKIYRIIIEDRKNEQQSGEYLKKY